MTNERNGTMSIIAWIIIGGLAGWIASKIMKTDEQMGIVSNVGVGILGGWILGSFGTNPMGSGWLISLFTATFGAVLLLFAAGLVRLRR